ncbi:hypothetical protein JST97_22175 [bacterium]|nr:hypothetical protein [bacterium]
MVVCSCCNQNVLKAWLTTREQPACEDCIRYLPDCPYCERAILPDDGITHYFEDDDELSTTTSYCHACAEGKPLCVVCSLPIFAETSRPGYCPRCILERKFCLHCQRDCSEHYIIVPEGIFCPSCCPCDTCRAIGVELLEGRCRFCWASQVSTLQEGLDLYPAAYEFLHEVMGLSLTRVPELKLTLEQPEVRVRQYSRALPGGGPGGLHSSEGWIWVKGDYPDHLCVLVLVHELAHAWQHENCPPLSDELTEGFAVWMQYQCALHLDYPELAQVMVDNPCPVYGGGLRACLAWEKAHGTARFLSELLSSRDIPAKYKRN